MILQGIRVRTSPKHPLPRTDAAVERIDRTSELLDALFSYTKASDPDLALDTEPVDLREVAELGLATSAKLAEAMGMSLEARVDDGRLSIELRDHQS